MALSFGLLDDESSISDSLGSWLTEEKFHFIFFLRYLNVSAPSGIIEIVPHLKLGDDLILAAKVLRNVLSSHLSVKLSVCFVLHIIVSWLI